MRCESCGLEAPTASVRLYQNIGMLIMRRYLTIKGNLCKPCIDSYFWRFTLVNSTLGWWGMISLFATPLFIANNLFQFIKSRGLGTAAPGFASLPTYVGSPSTQVQCPHCQSYQTKVAALGFTVVLSMIVCGFVGVLLLLFGVLFMLVPVKGGSIQAADIVGGIIIMGIALFPALILWMALSHRMWWCQQCNRVWAPRRN
jgi:hypothetical protein